MGIRYRGTGLIGWIEWLHFRLLARTYRILHWQEWKAVTEEQRREFGVPDPEEQQRHCDGKVKR